ncbi:Tudor/PWWP/MBT [Neoconidiobolus thromboides FSU 785]|nr:Tudor/PWWP/MBT [Neoconidiobolus thromboides FSU 785]
MKTDYKVGEKVWAKLKGYPWWPARIEDEANLPKKVLSKKPKNHSIAVWAVFFYGSRDYGWFNKDNLRDFDDHFEEYKTPARKTNLFTEALKQAQDPAVLQKIIEDEEKLKEDDPEEEEEEKKEKSKKEKVVKRKSSKVDIKSVKKAIQPPPNPLKSHTMETRTSSRFNKPPKENPFPDLTGLSNLDALRSLRQALQKATLKNNYEDTFLVDKIIYELEQSRALIEDVLESKISKLIRHLLAQPIPTSRFNFKRRLTDLVLKYKNQKNNNNNGILNATTIEEKKRLIQEKLDKADTVKGANKDDIKPEVKKDDIKKDSDEEKETSNKEEENSEKEKDIEEKETKEKEVEKKETEEKKAEEKEIEKKETDGKEINEKVVDEKEVEEKEEIKPKINGQDKKENHNHEINNVEKNGNAKEDKQDNSTNKSVDKEDSSGSSITKD